MRYQAGTMVADTLEEAKEKVEKRYKKPKDTVHAYWKTNQAGTSFLICTDADHKFLGRSDGIRKIP